MDKKSFFYIFLAMVGIILLLIYLIIYQGYERFQEGIRKEQHEAENYRNLTMIREFRARSERNQTTANRILRKKENLNMKLPSEQVVVLASPDALEPPEFNVESEIDAALATSDGLAGFSNPQRWNELLFGYRR